MPTLQPRLQVTARSLAPLTSGQREQAAEPFHRCGDWLCVKTLSRGRWNHVFQARPSSAAADHPADYVLKVLRAEGTDFDAAKQALHREAVVAKQMSHPRLAVVLASRLESPPYYLVLPFSEGVSLGRMLEQLSAAPCNVLGRPATVSLSRALWQIRQLAEGLAALHRGGWLHGDVKPSNVIVAPRGEVTLFDFGFARQLGSVECRGEQTWFGTVRYAAPESFLPGRELTAAADTYSAGLILFELLTGASALAGIPLDDVPLAHLRRPLPDLRNFRRDLPTKLVRLVRQMTAKEPLRRPCDEELVDTLVSLEIETLTER